MSGICGIVLDDADALIDRALLQSLTRRMSFRGPDGQHAWHEGRVGLGHAMLRTTHEARLEVQPATLDRQTWVTADARIDGRPALVSALASHGHSCREDAPDAELILHSYEAWGERCVEHLLGDFSFAVWDQRRQALFCARDHFGVKPFFHGHAGGAFIFSNTLDILRAHPHVSRALDDLAIADFLLFDMIQDPSSTAFAAVRRLPPAHCLTLSNGRVAVRRYWELPRDHGVLYRDQGDYVARFSDVLGMAVSDRLRTDRISVSMSGGLDSPALAAAALRVTRDAGSPLDLRAYTVVYDRLIPDSERHFSQLAADALRIPIRHRPADDYPLFGGHDGSTWSYAEPSHEPEGEASYHLLRDQAAHARVSLMGWDGDALLNESPKPYFSSLLRQRELRRLVAGVIRYAADERRIVPRSLINALRPRHGGINEDVFAGYPRWLNPDLEKNLQLRDRWRAVQGQSRTTHPLRPYAHHILSWLGRWSNFFDRFDPGVTRLPLEVRQPFLDLRVVDFCLALPPFPWCTRKRILRESLRGAVPEEIRRRPKTPLGNPGAKLLWREDAAWVDDFIATPQLARYIDRRRIPRVWRAARPQDAWSDLRPLTLDFWLKTAACDPSQEVFS